jgi:RND family efflux transporter MFP subunit
MSQVNQSAEEQLRAEIAELRRQLEEQKKRPAGAPSWRTLVMVLLLLASLGVAGYFLGYAPRVHREQVLAAESRAGGEAQPVVNVELVERAVSQSSLVLPGTVQAVTEAPVLARSTGYIKKRHVDIGDRVQAGQVLAEIEAPELGQQIRQAKATVEQNNQQVQQAEAALVQGRANLNLARVSRDRYETLAGQGVISKQERDQYQAQYEAQQANVQALEKAIGAAKSNVAAAEANLARPNDVIEYQTVRAPFAGVITVRNIDTGALVNEGSTLLFRIAQTGRLRTYVNVPQSEAESIRPGMKASLSVPDLAGRTFTGTVARTANALDPASRTLLVEVQIDNTSGVLMPGMYTQVDLAVPRKNPPLMIPADTLVIRADGPQVAVVNPEGVVHFTRVQLGRDLGEKLEALGGVQQGDRLAVNPGDAVREGARVKAVAAEKKK